MSNNNFEAMKNKKIYIPTEGEGFINATKIIAWIELVCSCIAAIRFWIKSSEVASSIESIYKTFGLYSLISGIVIFILLMTVHYIGKNMINLIRHQNNV